MRDVVARPEGAVAVAEDQAVGGRPVDVRNGVLDVAHVIADVGEIGVGAVDAEHGGILLFGRRVVGEVHSAEGRDKLCAGHGLVRTKRRHAHTVHQAVFVDKADVIIVGRLFGNVGEGIHPFRLGRRFFFLRLFLFRNLLEGRRQRLAVLDEVLHRVGRHAGVRVHGVGAVARRRRGYSRRAELHGVDLIILVRRDREGDVVAVCDGDFILAVGRGLRRDLAVRHIRDLHGVEAGNLIASEVGIEGEGLALVDEEGLVEIVVFKLRGRRSGVGHAHGVLVAGADADGRGVEREVVAVEVDGDVALGIVVAVVLRDLLVLAEADVVGTGGSRRIGGQRGVAVFDRIEGVHDIVVVGEEGAAVVNGHAAEIADRNVDIKVISVDINAEGDELIALGVGLHVRILDGAQVGRRGGLGLDRAVAADRQDFDIDVIGILRKVVGVELLHGTVSRLGVLDEINVRRRKAVPDRISVLLHLDVYDFVEVEIFLAFHDLDAGQLYGAGNFLAVVRDLHIEVIDVVRADLGLFKGFVDLIAQRLDFVRRQGFPNSISFHHGDLGTGEIELFTDLILFLREAADIDLQRVGRGLRLDGDTLCRGLSTIRNCAGLVRFFEGCARLDGIAGTAGDLGEGIVGIFNLDLNFGKRVPDGKSVCEFFAGIGDLDFLHTKRNNFNVFHGDGRTVIRHGHGGCPRVEIAARRL